MAAVTITKKGALIAGGGILAVFVAYIPGAGPCGPSTIPGMILIMGGLLAVPVGIVTLVIGWFIENLNPPETESATPSENPDGLASKS